ncbi:Coenzyme A biosynthesis bifunctional protein CoaBC [Streptomyces tanashiensis]
MGAPGDPGERGDPAPPRRRRHRARRRPPHRRRHRQGPAPDPAEIFEVCRRILARGTAAPDLAGRHVVVSAGGTREPLDPVRYLGNRSSGKQGYALARAAAARGARVTLVEANTGIADPAGVDVVHVGTAVQLREAVLKAAADADAVVMAAAVADFRPGRLRPRQDQEDGRRGSADDLELVRNPDILAELAADRALPGQVVVGFAAETDDVLANGRAKLRRKGCDLLVVNEVGERKTFGSEENEAVVLASDGAETPVPYGPKEALAETVWDLVAAAAAPRDLTDPGRLHGGRQVGGKSLPGGVKRHPGRRETPCQE